VVFGLVFRGGFRGTVGRGRMASGGSGTKDRRAQKFAGDAKTRTAICWLLFFLSSRLTPLNEEVSGHCPYNETACQSLVSFAFSLPRAHSSISQPLIRHRKREQNRRDSAAEGGSFILF